MANRTPEQDQHFEAVNQWLASKWTAPNKDCPICGGNWWSVSEVTELPENNEGPGPDATVPLSPVGCENCGYTFFINSARSGASETPALPEAAEGQVIEGLAI